MKILIISPPNSFTDVKTKKSKSFENRIVPLNLAQIGTVLKNNNHQVKIIDALAGEYSLAEIVQEMENFNPELIILSPFDRCRWGLPATVELLSTKEIINNRQIGLLGGYNRKFIFDFLPHFPQIDFATFGDPEFTLLKIANSENWNNVDGVIHHLHNQLQLNGEMIFIQNFDDIPIVDRTLLDSTLYQRFPHEVKTNHSIDLEASRGCPFGCIFCLVGQISGSLYRVRSVDNVMQEIEQLKQSHTNQNKLLELHFIDTVFTMKRDWALEFCQKFSNTRSPIIWSCQTRVDLVDEELLRMMKASGCFSILYGIESFNPQILETAAKKVSIEKMRETIKLTQDIGIETRLSLIFGLPGENPTIARQTIKRVIDLDPDFVQFHAAIAFPGTPLYENADGWGRIEKFENKSYDLVGSPFVPFGYKNVEEIKATQKEAYRRFYLRPKFWWKKIVKINEWPRWFTGVKILLRLL